MSYSLTKQRFIKGRLWDLQNARQILKIHNLKGPTFFPPTLALTRSRGRGVCYDHLIDVLSVQ